MKVISAHVGGVHSAVTKLGRVQSVLSVRFFSRSRTASAAPAGCGRVQRKRSDVKRVTQSREHSALSKIFLQSTVRRAWLDEST